MNDKKQIFIVRLIIYVLFGLINPSIYLICRFNLFSVMEQRQIGIWGIIFIFFLLGFFVNMIKQIRKGMTYSLFTQCLDGIQKILIPLLIAIVCIYLSKDFIDEIFEFLIVVFVCEMIAIPFNPLPKWCYEHKIEQTAFSIRNVLDILKKNKTDKE